MYGSFSLLKVFSDSRILDLFWIVPGLFLVVSRFISCVVFSLLQITKENKIDDDGSGISRGGGKYHKPSNILI